MRCSDIHQRITKGEGIQANVLRWMLTPLRQSQVTGLHVLRQAQVRSRCVALDFGTRKGQGQVKAKKQSPRSRASRKRAQAPVRNRLASSAEEVRASVNVAASRGGFIATAPALNFSTFNNVMTASRLNSFGSCMRRHFWSYEIGLRSTEVGNALRIGSAWARATEARWKGADYETALVAAIPEGIDMDAVSCNTVAALLAGYYDLYGPIENLARIHPEVQFEHDLIEGFTAQGKMDGLGSDSDNMSVIVEGKTTSERLDSDSPYWDRLRFNIQLLQYVVAAGKGGWDIDRVIYDVCRKPTIRPKKAIIELDELGRKIVVDREGNRVFKRKKVFMSKHDSGNPKAKKIPVMVEDLNDPVQSGSTKNGWELKKHIETPEEYSDRVYKDTLARPEFYFARKEVRILEETIQKFERHREAMILMIIHLRSTERPTDWERDPEAWPRNIKKENCNFCAFRPFCLTGLSINPHNPPHGFEITPFNPELEQQTNTEEQDETTDETTD